MGIALFDLLPEPNGGIGFRLVHSTSHTQAGLSFNGCATPVFALVLWLLAHHPFFVSHIGPQSIDLNLTDLIVIEQNPFHLLGVVRRFSQKRQEGIFFDAFGTANTY